MLNCYCKMGKYDVIFFDLDGTLRSNHHSKIPIERVASINELQKKYDIKIITDNHACKENLEDKINKNGITCEVISPINKQMNPNDERWFVYDNAVYLLYTIEVTYDFVSKALEYGEIRVIEEHHSVGSRVYNMYPNIRLFHIGYILDFFRRFHPSVNIKIVGKQSYDFKEQYENQNVLVVGDASNDENFAKNNGFDFIKVSDHNSEFKNIDEVISELQY